MRNKLLFAAALLAASCTSIPFEDCFDENGKWSLVVESLSDPDVTETYTNGNCESPVVSMKKGVKTISYSKIGGKDITVEIAFSKASSDNGLLVTPKLTNNEEGWVVTAFNGMEIKGFGIENPADYSFIAPNGNGKKTNMTALAEALEKKPGKVGGWNRSTKGDFYFTSATGKMCFSVLDGKNGSGLYVGTEDEHYDNVSIDVRYYPEAKTIAYFPKYRFFCHPGETFNMAPVNYWAYKGDWRTAADHYREWYTAHYEIARHPEWLRNTTGWMLTIMKQQNGEVIWPYNAIGREMADAAEANGMNLLGLFGRAIGGHDRFYPDYTSDPEMGGEEAFKQGLKELHDRGMRAIVYTNGQLLDCNGIDDWYETTGKNISVVNKEGEVYGESFQKFFDGPNRQFTWACTRTPEWQDKLMQFALDAARLGADGMIYDQLGGLHYRRCYAKDHGHNSPDFAYGSDQLEIFARILKKVHEINPDFVFMTEGYMDALLPTVGISHRGMQGKVYSAFKQKNLEAMATESGITYMFPQFFLYTFPEVVVTSNNPAPLNKREYLNYAAVFNERPEIEVRYAPDKEMLLTEKNRTPEEYKNIKGPASGSGPYHTDMVVNGDATASRIYSKQVLGMLKDHADVMYEGKFTDDAGFRIESANPLVYAKSYRNGNKLAVIVWNIDTENAAEYTVTPDAGYKLKEITAPDVAVTEGCSINPQSLHLLIFEK